MEHGAAACGDVAAGGHDRVIGETTGRSNLREQCSGLCHNLIHDWRGKAFHFPPVAGLQLENASLISAHDPGYFGSGKRHGEA